MESGNKGFISKTKLLHQAVFQTELRPLLLLFAEAYSENCSRHESSFDCIQPTHTHVIGSPRGFQTYSYSCSITLSVLCHDSETVLILLTPCREQRYLTYSHTFENDSMQASITPPYPAVHPQENSRVRVLIFTIFQLHHYQI